MVLEGFLGLPWEICGLVEIGPGGGGHGCELDERREKGGGEGGEGLGLDEFCRGWERKREELGQGIGFRIARVLYLLTMQQ